jgi:threonyl-tRNA synthetase
VVDALQAAGIRAEADFRNEKINYKVREHSLAKVPNLLVIGKRESEERTVALRPLGTDARQEVLPLDQLVERLKAEAVPPDLRGA